MQMHCQGNASVIPLALTNHGDFCPPSRNNGSTDTAFWPLGEGDR
jgi:hypothetical protein